MHSKIPPVCVLIQESHTTMAIKGSNTHNILLTVFCCRTELLLTSIEGGIGWRARPLQIKGRPFGVLDAAVLSERPINSEYLLRRTGKQLTML